jgi:hypothetical protein
LKIFPFINTEEELRRRVGSDEIWYGIFSPCRSKLEVNLSMCTSLKLMGEKKISSIHS